MHRRSPDEFVYQLFALIVSAILVYAFYVALIRPHATAILAEQAARLKADPDYAPNRSFWVVIHGYEQESAMVVFLWGMAMMAYKFRTIQRERRLFQLDLIPLTEGQSILPEDSREYARAIEAFLEQEGEFLLPRALLEALNRFRTTRNIQDASAEIDRVCDTHMDRLDSELGILRYIAWVIPAIGFVGTVRGIGGAMGQAYKAVKGDVSGIVEYLGVTFNSTLVALLLAVVLMFVLHALQLVQEKLVIDARARCDRQLIQHLLSR